MVGNPFMSYLSDIAYSAVASTFANIIGGFSSANSLAAEIYSGNKVLQWPHQGA